MSIKGKIEEAAGFLKEEIFEHGKSAETRSARRKDAICATRAASRMAKRPRRPNPVPDIPKVDRRYMPPRYGRGGIPLACVSLPSVSASPVA